MTMDAMPRALLERVAKARVLGKSPVGVYLRVNDWIWRHLPGSIAALRPIDWYGRFLHSLACLHADREMYLGTFFLRNRAELREFITAHVLDLVAAIMSLAGGGASVAGLRLLAAGFRMVWRCWPAGSRRRWSRCP